MSSHETIVDAESAIDAWRARGDHRLDPVRFRLIEVLARRAATHGGRSRQVLDEKLGTLIAAYGVAVEKTRRAEAEAAMPSPKAKRQAGPLATLVAHAASQATLHGEGAASSSSPSELKTLSYFRSTWSKLSADRRLTQSLAKVPENAGPLNSHHLVHRSLSLMRELSPAYLERFMAHVDALLWLDQANTRQGMASPDSPRAEGQRKASRGKS